MATLSEQIQSWRTAADGQNSSGNGHNGLLSKLSIAGSLYDIKDPAVEALAGLIETRLGTLENKTWTAVNKGANDAKFATGVTQGTDGSISVTYGTIRDAALSDSATTGQYVTAVSQDVDGIITVTKGGVAAENVTFAASSGVDLSSTNVKAAIEEVLADAMALKGTSSDQSSAETIAAAKKYAEELVNDLAGEDWTTAAQTVKDIIDELGGDNAGWSTLVDKLQGMTYSQDDGQGGTETVTASSVADYVTHKIAEVNAANADGINALDAVVYGAGSNGTSATTDASTAATSYTNDSTNKVVVKVTEVDGKITGVDVKTNDVASAQALTTLDGAAVKSVNGETPTNGAVTLYASNIDVSSSDTTKVSTALATLSSDKANKAAITTGSVNNWGTPTYASETLTWTNVATNVYVPGTGSL